MATTITDVTELQAMEDDLTATYELGNDIDATATQTQNPTLDRGNWAADTPYLINDYVLRSGYYYVCIENHTSGASFEPGKWQLWDSVEPSQYLGFIPVGTSFTGHLDGKNYTITGLYIDRNRPYIGLFAEVGSGGSVQDMVLADVDIRGEDYVGALAGVLDTCTVTGCSSSGVVSAYESEVGGLIGLSMEATVSDSYSSCTVTGITGSDTGGFCGYCMLDTVTNCYATGAVVGNVGADALGGFVGDVNGSEISECYATGSVTVEEVRYAGGFAGLIRGNAVIEECYSTGDVTGTNAEYYIGGFVGDVVGSGNTITNCYAMGDASAVTAEDVGGFAGENAGTITDCYSKGSVGGSLNVGGFCGTNDGTITDCFWDTETSGQATSDGGTGKTTEEMKTYDTFYDIGWDIAEAEADRNDGYAFLHWEIGGASPIWKIYAVGTRCFTIPDLYDHRGRVPKGARVRAYRVDTHVLVGEGILDENGNATICGLPNDVDVVFHVTWGGPRTPRQYTHIRRGFS